MLWTNQLNVVWASHLCVLFQCRNRHARTYCASIRWNNHTWIICRIRVSDSNDWKLNQQDFISVDCQVGLVVLVTGTRSEMGMTEVEEDRFLCLYCVALHFQAMYCSRRALCIHMTKSKNPKCVHEWGKIKGITDPGNVIAGGACGMGPCPPPQHEPQGVEYTHNILCIFNLHSVYIYNKYTFVYGICYVYFLYIHSM
jgi:hypothetical protein